VLSRPSADSFAVGRRQKEVNLYSGIGQGMMFAAVWQPPKPTVMPHVRPSVRAERDRESLCLSYRWTAVARLRLCPLHNCKNSKLPCYLESALLRSLLTELQCFAPCLYLAFEIRPGPYATSKSFYLVVAEDKINGQLSSGLLIHAASGRVGWRAMGMVEAGSEAAAAGTLAKHCRRFMGRREREEKWLDGDISVQPL
jgi:hypothetical protein